MPILYIAITNHGFGHATRAAAVAAEIQRRNPDLTLILATTAPRSVLAAYLGDNFIHRPRAFDVGVLQSDSITMDLPGTLEKLQSIQENARSTIVSEANWLKQNRVDLVLADIPPLAAAFAEAAGVPCWMMGNFGWDFIYRAFGEEFGEVADWISECFAKCDLLLRMPFHEPMSAFQNIVDVGLTGVSPRYPQETIVEAFQLAEIPKEKRIMMTFGGLGLAQIPYENVLQFPEHRFLCFDLNAPDYPNLVKVDDRVYRPIDLMETCGCLISKPGYSTFSEACRLDLPIISLVREGFAEAPVLLEGLRDYAYHQIVEPNTFFHSQWEFLAEPLVAPRKTEKLSKDGNSTIAQAVTDFFNAALLQ
jgi:spore coat polysaccharide biosynthesis predicted glycosyltransferase SpsG